MSERTAREWLVKQAKDVHVVLFSDLITYHDKLHEEEKPADDKVRETMKRLTYFHCPFHLSESILGQIADAILAEFDVREKEGK